jgi:hypothetical protein
MDEFLILDLDYSSYDKSFSLLISSNNVDSIKWHARLSHIGQERMTRLARESLLGNLAKVSMSICEHCPKGKSIRKSFGKAIRASFPLQLVHSGICGPINMRARHGGFYFITFIDDFLRYGHFYLISHKSEALDCFRRYMNMVEMIKE